MVKEPEPIRLIFHVGMGKTGTSSIQSALRQNAKALKDQRVEYLGLWFDVIDASYKYYVGQEKLIKSSVEEKQASAEKIWQYFKEKRSKDGILSFVFSNEHMALCYDLMEPFLRRLEERGVEISIVCYVRDPVNWLPSAYYQWRVVHKAVPGPLHSYHSSARELISWYQAPLLWEKKFPGNVIVRSYDACSNVVEDFADAVSLSLTAPEIRENTTATTDEMFLRAFFSNLVSDAMLPDVFTNAVGVSPNDSPSVSGILKDAFDLSSTSEIIAENEDVFAAYREHFGFDPRAVSPDTLPSMPDTEAVRDRLVEVVTSVTLDQSMRIRNLETEVETLRNGLQALLATYSAKYRHDPDRAAELVISDSLDHSLKVRSLETEFGALHETLQAQLATASAQQRRSWAYRWRAARSGLVARLLKLK
ncbi:hypothetical protein R5H32_08205 [Defluviimonas sp. D31]|nr:hypothetical protein [Defluviimonas sp. D31]